MISIADKPGLTARMKSGAAGYVTGTDAGAVGVVEATVKPTGLNGVGSGKTDDVGTVAALFEKLRFVTLLR